MASSPVTNYRPPLEVKSIKLEEGRNEVNCVIYGPDGDLYVSYGHHIVTISSTMKVARFAGHPSKSGSRNGPRLKALFMDVYGMCFTASGALLVLENVGQRVQIIENDEVQTYAGSGTPGFLDGPKLQAMFSNPSDIVECDGIYYLSDFTNDRIRMITPDGMVSSIGSGRTESIDGTFTDCAFHRPWGLCVAANNTVLVADYHGHCIRAIGHDRTVTTLLGGGGKGFADGDQPKFNGPIGMCTGPSGEIYVIDRHNYRIRTISPDGVVSTLLGGADGVLDGPIELAQTKNHQSICLTPNGDLFWTEYPNNQVRYISGFIPDMHLRREAAPERFASFLPLLLDGQYADLDFVHTATNLTFKLHRNVLRVTCSRMLKEKYRDKLAASNVTGQALTAFLHLLYGTKPFSAKDIEIPYLEMASVYAQICYLSTLLHRKSAWAQWAEKHLAAVLPRLDTAQTIDLLLDIVRRCEEHPTLIDLVKGRLKTNRSDFLKKKHLLEPLATELNLINLFSSLLVDIASDATPPPYKPAGSRTELYLKALEVMNEMAKQVRWTTTPDEPASENWAIPPNWTVSAAGSPLKIHVHDWILYPRWSYFRRLLNSGMAESKERHFEFPPEWNDELVLFFIKYLYNGSVSDPSSINSSPTPLSADKCRFLLLNGEELSILDDEKSPTNGFESLVTHCREKILVPLTLENAVSALSSRLEFGSNRDIRAAMTYLGRHIDFVSKIESQWLELRRLPTQLQAELLFIRFPGPEGNFTPKSILKSLAKPSKQKS